MNSAHIFNIINYFLRPFFAIMPNASDSHHTCITIHPIRSIRSSLYILLKFNLIISQELCKPMRWRRTYLNLWRRSEKWLLSSLEPRAVDSLKRPDSEDEMPRFRTGDADPSWRATLLVELAGRLSASLGVLDGNRLFDGRPRGS